MAAGQNKNILQWNLIDIILHNAFFGVICFWVCLFLYFFSLLWIIRFSDHTFYFQFLWRLYQWDSTAYIKIQHYASNRVGKGKTRLVQCRTDDISPARQCVGQDSLSSLSSSWELQLCALWIMCTLRSFPPRVSLQSSATDDYLVTNANRKKKICSEWPLVSVPTIMSLICLRSHNGTADSGAKLMIKGQLLE